MRLETICPQTGLRARISAAYRRPETECVPELLRHAGQSFSSEVHNLAARLVHALRGKHSRNDMQSLMQEFSLASPQGIALMSLAEALLRIPDNATRDALIRDKIGGRAWDMQQNASSSAFANAAAWALRLSGKLLDEHIGKSMPSVAHLIARSGEPLIRHGVNLAVDLLGEQFVAGQTIQQALDNGRRPQERGYRYSFDMLGEAAMTEQEAQRYYAAYESAIHAIGATTQGRGPREESGISIKLSALHSRYSRAQRERVMTELLPRLSSLAALARHYSMGINIDAEESERLDLSLDLLEALCADPELADWDGIGFVVQAYQKRALAVVDYLVDLARRSGRRLMLRLVKGAYWDAEIKKAQLDGMADYPVYTRKIHTDLSYMACARRMLDASAWIYPQFATHNAQTLAMIYHLAGGVDCDPQRYEFQCLHGMGEALYDEIIGPVQQGGLGRPCRIYAPVGSHDRLLAYLVRRLLENGANTSFVHQLGDKNVVLDCLLQDPVEQALALQPVGRPHDKIPLPENVYQPAEQRLNSAGLDLADEASLHKLWVALSGSAVRTWRAEPAAQSSIESSSQARQVLNPADHTDVVGLVVDANDEQVKLAVAGAMRAAPNWAATPVAMRATVLRRAAQIFEDRKYSLYGLIVREAGKSLPTAVAELRETVDFLRYYAEQACTFSPMPPPLGLVACISPWNFPLSIFTGQIAAALAVGNTVLAKPAEQSSLTAAQAVAILHEAGVPDAALQLLPGPGEYIGARLVADPHLAGVMFTGSTEVAKGIARTLALRLDDEDRIIPLIAETGGINAMVVDSSALTEQAVADILVSAFDSAGQRCSSLRLLCVQEDCADKLLEMLEGALRQLRLGLPERLDTDVGPLIDAQARKAVDTHIEAMRQAGRHIVQQDLGVECGRGTFVAPALIMLDSVADLKKEVFGPVLHVVRYRRKNLDVLIDAINAKGYGLTFGMHTRLDSVVSHLASRVKAGNIYVNRNMIGAVVGVQPFGGEGLSGTGPKAGGPLYLRRLVRPLSLSLPESYKAVRDGVCECVLPGPVGESNIYRVAPRGTVLCWAATLGGAQAQLCACLETGNRALFVQNSPSLALAASCSFEQRERLELAAENIVQQRDAYDAVLFEGDAHALIQLNSTVTALDGPIVPVQGMTSKALRHGGHYALECLLREVSLSINTAAAGGNASLLTMA